MKLLPAVSLSFLLLFYLPVSGLGQRETSKEPEESKNVSSANQAVLWPKKYDSQIRKPIRLFMTREEVREMWGEPERHLRTGLDGESRQGEREYFSPPEYEAALQRYGPLQDVYYRKTKKTRYEILVTYREVPRKVPREAPGEVQTPPELRVSRLTFMPDEKLSVDEIQGDLPETKDLCGAVCKPDKARSSLKLGEVDSGFKSREINKTCSWECRGYLSMLGFPAILVYSKSPSDVQRREAKDMAHWWESPSYPMMAEEGDWVPVLRLWLQSRAGGRQAGSLTDELVEMATLALDAPEWTLKVSEIKFSFGFLGGSEKVSEQDLKQTLRDLRNDRERLKRQVEILEERLRVGLKTDLINEIDASVFPNLKRKIRFAETMTGMAEKELKRRSDSKAEN